MRLIDLLERLDSDEYLKIEVSNDSAIVDCTSIDCTFMLKSSILNATVERIIARKWGLHIFIFREDIFSED